MKNASDVHDAEFCDDKLEAQLRAAFDAVEPSEQASARMLANLKAYEQQARDATLPTSSEHDTVLPTGAGQNAALPTSLEHDTTHPPVADILTMPKAKRSMRPWQLLIPAAAVLVLALGVASVTALHGPSLDASLQQAESAEQAFEPVAQDTIADKAAESIDAEIAPSAEYNKADELVAEEATTLSDTAISPLTSSASAEHGMADTSNSATNSDTPWIHKFTTIVLDDDTVFIIDTSAATAPVGASEVGAFAGEAVAYNADKTISQACKLYASKTDDDVFLVSSFDEDIYYEVRKA